MRKLKEAKDLVEQGGCFSPLAGIRYAETQANITYQSDGVNSFSPLAGIRYAETPSLASTVI